MAGPGATYILDVQVRGLLVLEKGLKDNIATTKRLGQDATKLEQQLASVQNRLSQIGTTKTGGGGGGTRGGGGAGGPFAGLREAFAAPGGGAVFEASRTGLEALSATMQGLASGIAVVKEAFKLAAAAVNEFAQKEVAVTKLDQALANQGQLTNEYRAQLQGLAEQMETATNIADDQWLGALAKLTQFGADTSNIEKYAEATKNIVAITGTDAVQAASLWGRATQGNFTALARLGIQVDKNASQTEKLNQAYEQLALRGGGILESQTKTTEGQFKTFRTAVSNLLEGMGTLIKDTGVLEEIFFGLGKTTAWLASLFPKTIEQVEGISNKIPTGVKAFDEFSEASEGAGESIKEFTEATKKSSEASEKEVKLLDQRRQQMDAMADAQTALKIAQIDLAEAQGKISPEAADLQRAQVRASAEQAKTERELAAIAEEKTVLNARSEKLQEDAAETSAITLELEKQLVSLYEQEVVLQELLKQGRKEQNEALIETAIRENAVRVATIKRIESEALPKAKEAAQERLAVITPELAKIGEKRGELSSRQAVLGVQAQVTATKFQAEQIGLRAKTAGAGEAASVPGIATAALAQAGRQDPAALGGVRISDSSAVVSAIEAAGADVNKFYEKVLQAMQQMRSESRSAQEKLRNQNMITEKNRPNGI